MKLTLKAAAAVILAASLVVSYAQTGNATLPAKKTAAKKKADAPPEPSVADQIETVRQQLQSEIDSLKSNLADKDAQLTQAQAAAAKAQAQADAESQALTENSGAVTTLQSTVTDLKANEVSLAATVSNETTAIKKSVAAPDTLHYKGITITPGGYGAGETVYRTKATGGDIPTAFTSIPYEGSDLYSLSEFYGSARQSRIAMMAEGTTSWGTLRGYWEGDFLGAGISSNNNQSNSYVFRQRVLWAQAALNNGWAFTGGQLWSLATEDRTGISNLSGDILTPLTIDPNYVVGFVWTRQYGFRITKTMKHVAFGVAAENPQLLYTASLAGNTPYAVLGAAGANGGNYNAAITSVTATTYIQNYATETGTSNATGVTPVEIPVYNTITANTNIANYAFNEAPDMIVKAAIDPGWGHYEIIGIARFAHETVYPGVTTNSVKYGGLYNIECPSTTFSSTCTPVAASSTTAGSYNDSIVLGGVSGSFRVPLDPKGIVTFGTKALYGPGMGRYGDSTLSDVTANATGGLSPIHNFSGLTTIEANPTPRLSLYLNYGIDYAGREDYSTANTTTLGSPAATFCPTGYTIATASTACTKTPTATLLAAGGIWGGQWSAPSQAAVGYGSRELSNSACTSIAAAGYNTGSSTGFQPGTACGAQNRNLQEATGGYWYDLYRGDGGRLRQSIQYGYAVREGWSGAAGIGAKGIDNMFWTSFRYYLP